MNNAEFKQHISKKYNTELEDIRSLVFRMGGLVQKQTADAITAMTNHKPDLAEEVIKSDHTVNGFEVLIDDECSKIIALRQPAAADLRLVVAIIKTITDLERIGDQAEHIARFALRMNNHNSSARPELYLNMSHLAERVLALLSQTLESFARLDAETALQAVKMDATIDSEYEAIMRQLSTYMMEDPRTISRVLDAMWVARSLERIGDHAKNICEYVIYLIKGKNVRHVSMAEMEQLVLQNQNN